MGKKDVLAYAGKGKSCVSWLIAASLGLLSASCGTLRIAPAGPFELDGLAHLRPAPPLSLTRHLGEYTRLYLDAYLLRPREDHAPGFRIMRRPRFSAPAWKSFDSLNCAAAGVLSIGIVSNPALLPGGADILDVLFNEPRWGRWAAADLVALARQDHLSGLAVAFQGGGEDFQVPFLDWFRSLVAAGHAQGLEVDVFLAPQFADNGNRRIAGMQSFLGLAESADQVVFASGDAAVPHGGTDLEPLPSTGMRQALDYAQDRIPAGKGIFKLEVGGRLFRGSQMVWMDRRQWEQLVHEYGSPQRMDDGRLSVDTGNGIATYFGAEATAYWIDQVRKAGFKGVCLSPAPETDPDFWPWWRGNKSSF